jgi:hypothetical protein
LFEPNKSFHSMFFATNILVSWEICKTLSSENPSWYYSRIWTVINYIENHIFDSWFFERKAQIIQRTPSLPICALSFFTRSDLETSVVISIFRRINCWRSSFTDFRSDICIHKFRNCTTTFKIIKKVVSLSNDNWLSNGFQTLISCHPE